MSRGRFGTGVVAILGLAFQVSGQDEVWTWSEAPVPDVGFDLDAARVLRVTNLKRDGRGSLAAALRAEGPRIVVFEVGGVIDLERRGLSIRSPQVVVAGQTAPDPGITVIRGGLFVAASQVLVQHLAIRPGDAGVPKRGGFSPDGISTAGAIRDVWIDHCSITWAVDENLSASSYGAPEGRSARRIVFRDCLIAQGLNDSSHPKGPHSKGTLVHDRTREVAIVRCLYGANVERNPLFKSNTSGVVVNCWISSPGQRGIHSQLPPDGSGIPAARVAVTGNHVTLAPHSKKQQAVVEGGAEWFLRDNLGFDTQGEMLPAIRKGEAKLDEPPVWPAGLEAFPAPEVPGRLAETVGARPWARDPIDQRIIDQASTGSLPILDSQEQAGGYPDRPMTRRALEVPERDRRTWLARMGR